MFFYINMLKCHSFTDVHYGNVLNRYFSQNTYLYNVKKVTLWAHNPIKCAFTVQFGTILIPINQYMDMEQPKQEPDANTKRFTGNLFFLLQIICHCFLSL